MKILFNRNNSIGILCLLLLAVLPVSCVKDDYAAKEKATVKMTFTTRAISGSSDTDADALEEYEHMRTLRVIVARASDNDILYNVKYDIAEVETSKTITFSELTIEKGGELFDFYAIANEDGVGYTDNWTTITVDNLKKISLTEAALAGLNNGNIYIPQTAHAQINVGEATDDVTIPLQFAVAKVRLTIENTSTAEQTVSDIRLSGVDMTSTPLFANRTLSGVTDGILDLDDMNDIDAGGSATVYAYFFENTGGDYKLTAKWNGTPQEIDLGDYDISKIERGTLLDITVNLQADVTISTTVEVLDWDNIEMNVPAFE